MPNLAKLSLTNHHHCLAEGLKESRNFIPSDLQIICQNGETVDCHQAVFASQCTSQSLIRELKSNPEDLICISVPEISKIHVESLIDILYSGITHQANSLDEINEIHIITELFCFSKIELLSSSSTVENLIPKDFEEENMRELSLVIQEVEEKKKQRSIPNSTTTSKKSKNAKIQESSISALDPGPHFDLDGPRRSKRPRPSNKHLEDYETPYRKTLIKDNETSQLTDGRSEPDRDFNSSTNAAATAEPIPFERTIANTKVHITLPKEEALEAMKTGNLPPDIVRDCLICDKRFVGRHAFEGHLRTKHSHGTFKCQCCEGIFMSGFKLHQHARSKIIQDNSNNSPNNLKKSTSSKSEQTTFFCNVQTCQEHFTTFKYFKNHTLSKHKVFPLLCTICQKRYKEQATFRNHMETHQGQLKYECDVCSKKFVTRERLFAHRRLHLGKRFACSQCEFRGKSSSALRTHIQTKHLEKRFQCTICQKRFSTLQNLSHHELTHTGFNPWHCHICPASFKRQHHLKSHLNSGMHKSKLTTTASGMVGNSSNNTSTAMNLNNYVKSSHKCEVCLVEFKQDFHLHQHIRSKSHSNKVEEVLSRGDPVPDHLVIQASDNNSRSSTTNTAAKFGGVPSSAQGPAHGHGVVNQDQIQSFVVPNLNQVFQPQPISLESTRTKFIDEDLINLADTTSDAASELFLDDPNIKLIIVNEANRDVMLMTSSAGTSSQTGSPSVEPKSAICLQNEVKLSDAVATEDSNLMSTMSLETE